MGTRLPPWLAAGGVAVLAMVSIPGVPLGAEAASTDSVGVAATAAENPDQGSVMRDGGHADMMSDGGQRDLMRSMPFVRSGHDPAGCREMMTSPGHDDRMAGNGHEQNTSGSARHGMS